MKDAAMNAQEGMSLMGITDPSVGKLLPPPLELTDPDNPMVYVYIVNIKEPTFGPWYMEAGIGVMAKYQDIVGLYFFNLQLSGPGAMMGAFTGRAFSGLPKKLCERIVVERTDDYGHCCVERSGIRLIDVELEIGHYNDPVTAMPQEACMEGGGRFLDAGGCLLHKYDWDGEKGFCDMAIYFYDSKTAFDHWEPAAATIKMEPSLDDPWAQIPIRTVLSAGWMKSDNWVEGLTKIYEYPDDAADDAMQYLFTGRWDRSLLCKHHQHYE